MGQDMEAMMTSADQKAICDDLDLMWELYCRFIPWNAKRQIDDFLNAKERIRSKLVENLDIVEVK